MPTQSLMSSDNVNEGMGNEAKRAAEAGDMIDPSLGGETGGPSEPGDQSRAPGAAEQPAGPGDSRGSGDKKQTEGQEEKEEEEPTAVEDKTPTVVKEILASLGEGKAKPNTRGTIKMMMPSGTNDKDEPVDELNYRVPLVGGVDYEKNESCEAMTGIAYHACKSMMGLRGILSDGRIRAMPYEEGDANSGSGTHGFYARAWVKQEWSKEENTKKLRETYRLATQSHCDTGLIVEIQYWAVKVVINTAGDEHTKVKPGHCTRYKSGKTDRWCFHEDCARIVAIWITPYAIQKHVGATSGGLPECYADMGAEKVNEGDAGETESKDQYTSREQDQWSSGQKGPWTKWDNGKKSRSKLYGKKNEDQSEGQGDDQDKYKGHDDKPWRKGDWECPKCKYHNYASRTTCHRCSADRTSGSVWHGGGGGGGGGDDSDSKRHKGECKQANLSKFLDAVRAMQ